MKTRTRLHVYLPIAAVILTAALAAAAGAQTQVPYGAGTAAIGLKGAFSGNDTVAGEGPCPATICTKGTGTATLLGQLSFTQETTVNFANFTETGSAQWTAANGDVIYTTVLGSAVPGDVAFTVTEIHTITGGTGRFAGAQGSFTVHRTHIVAFSEDGTHVTSGSFEGTISSPGEARQE